MEKTQREYYLNEQMKAIQKELNDEEGKDELAEIETRSRRPSSRRRRAKATHELKKLRQMSPMSAEATVVRNYLDWLLSIPWNKKSKVKKDLKAAQEILDNDHFGLEKVKAHRRVSRRPAARQQADRSDPVPGRPARRRQDLARQVDCEGDRPRLRARVARRRARRGRIRGHRRTYIGSMPARSSSRCARRSRRTCCSSSTSRQDGRHFRGDPSSALLECSMSRTTPSTTTISRSITTSPT
jgi:ATP-dependent Lon protease